MEVVIEYGFSGEREKCLCCKDVTGTILLFVK